MSSKHVVPAALLLSVFLVLLRTSSKSPSTQHMSMDHSVLDFSYLLATDEDIVNIIAVVSNGSRMLSECKLQLFLHRFAIQRTTNCKIQKRFGNVRDGGYEICLDPPFTPQPNTCMVYSFGINYDFSFDDAVNNEFNCEVHSFDPSMIEEKVHKYHKARPKVIFHLTGLYSTHFKRVDGWKLDSFANIRQELGHYKRVIDVVKIDIELSEWPVIRDIIVSGEFRFIKTLLIEIHTPQTKAPLSFQDYFHIFRLLIGLENAGFRKFMFHTRNDCCSSYQPMVFENIANGRRLCCYELFYINTNFYGHSQSNGDGLVDRRLLSQRLFGFEQMQFTDLDVEKYASMDQH